MRKLKVNDFFCGCGGMGIAFQNAGYEIAGAWDFDKYAVETYRRNVGEHVKQADIREMTYKDVPKADVWAFGFPCQDLSVGGKRKGMVLRCMDCGREIKVDPGESGGHGDGMACPGCGSRQLQAASRSGMFFEIMRLLEETWQHIPGNMPAVIIAENVGGLRPYLPVLGMEYKRHGYTMHAQMFNSKYWGVAQNRNRYAVVGTRDGLGLRFSFPVEQHEYVPRLRDQREKGNIPEKFYLSDEKARTIIAQAMEKLKAQGKLDTDDIDGTLVIFGDGQTEDDVVADLSAGAGLLRPDGVGRTLRVGGVEARTENTTTSTSSSTRGGGGGATKCNECGKHEPVRARNERKRLPCGGDSSDIDDQQGRGHKDNHDRGIAVIEDSELPLTVLVNKNGRNLMRTTDISPCLSARDYKGLSGRDGMAAVIEEAREERK